MVEAGVEDLQVHHLLFEGDNPALQGVIRNLRASLEGCDASPDGPLVSTWDGGELDGAVLMPTRYGAIPLLVHRTKQLYGGAAVKAMIEGQALLLGGLDDARVAATEEALGAHQWAAGRNQPTRFNLREAEEPGWVLGTATWAAEGHYAHWMVEATGAVSAGALRRAIADQVGPVLAVSEADALDPETGDYRPVLSVRVGATAVEAARSLAQAGLPVMVGDYPATLLPFTATRPRRRFVRQGPPALLPAHESLLSMGDRAWQGGNAHSLLVRRDALAQGGPVEGRTRVQAMASTGIGSWEAASNHGRARMARTTVAGAGMAVELWHWGAPERTHPGTAPPPPFGGGSSAGVQRQQ